MDQEKIGKLIADLRKRKNLTQQQLGDKVGVGYRAVSKWERGITCPDISIINDLSKELDITAGELLAGELTDETKSKFNIPVNKSHKKLFITLSILSIFLISIIFGTFYYFNNKEYVYDIRSLNQEVCYLEGKFTFRGSLISININKLIFQDSELNKKIINNYEYKIISNKNILMTYSKISEYKILLENESIKKFSENFNISYNTNYNIVRDNIVNDEVALIITFTTDNNQTIIQNIPFELVKGSIN